MIPGFDAAYYATPYFWITTAGIVLFLRWIAPRSAR